MSLYQTPPPSFPQGSNSSATPPTPHDPIGTGGDQPPRQQVFAALTMLVVLASWPADLEPRLQRPNDTTQKIAPLTLTYGQQPPKCSVANLMAQIAAQWPADLEPRLQRPNDQQTKIAALTLTYGSPPTPQGFVSPTALAPIVASWPSDTGPLLPYQPIRSLVSSTPVVSQPPITAPAGTIAAPIGQWPPETAQIRPLVATGGIIPASVSQPPVLGPPRLLALVVGSWPADLEPRLGVPHYPRSVPIAPLTLPTGTPPIPSGPLSTTELAQIVSTWPADMGPVLPWPDWTQRTSAWVTTQATVSAPPPTAPLSVATGAAIASWPADLEPRLGKPNDRQTTIAPLTLLTGTAPLPSGPLSATELAQIVASWAQTWDAQTAPKSAGWTVPPVLSSLPYTAPPRLLWTAWEPPWIAPPVPVTIAPLTLATGTPPPTRPPLLVAHGSAIAAWPADLEPRYDRTNHAQQKIAPLTLPTGSPPTPQSPLSATALAAIVASWPIDVGPTLPWHPAPSIVPTFPTVSPPPIQGPLSVAELTAIAATGPETWPAQTGPKSAAWTPPPILSYQPPRRFPDAIYGAAQPADPPPVQWRPSVVPIFAPVTQPPVRPALAVPQQTIVASWPVDVGPSLPWHPLPTVVQPFALLTGKRGFTSAFEWMGFWADIAPVPQPPLARPLLAAILASWPVDVGPMLPWRPPPSAVLSFPPVSAPPGQAALSGATRIAIAASGPESWPAQTGPQSAAWTPPPSLVYQPPRRFSDAILAANQAADPLPVQRLPSVVPTFPAVTQPPPRASLSATILAPLVASWPADLEPRLQTPNAQQIKIAPLTRPAVSAPPPSAIASPMAQALAAWPADLEPRLQTPNAQQIKIAPLTLPAGQAPPPRALVSVALQTVIAANRPDAWPAQTTPPAAALPPGPALIRGPVPAPIVTEVGDVTRTVPVGTTLGDLVRDAGTRLGGAAASPAPPSGAPSAALPPASPTPTLADLVSDVLTRLGGGGTS